MARLFAEPINLQQLEIQNVRLQQLSSPPGSPVAGQIWYNTADNRPQWYDGTSNWEIYPPATAATANTAVIRDGSGNFSATTITSNLTGTASIATTLNPTANVPMNNFKLTGLLDPTNPQDAATKNYVDSVASGLDVKGAVVCATTTTLPAYTPSGTSGGTLTANANGTLTIDGISPTLNQRVLVKNETGGNAPYNGIYTLTTVGNGSTPYVLTRSADANTVSPNLPGTVQTGMFTFCESGTLNTGAGFILTTTGTIILNSTNLTFTQFSGTGELIAGNGISISGNTISANVGSAFTFSSGALILASIVTAATATSITYNAQGQVTAGADIITSNGLVVRTGAGTFAAGTITGTTNQITVATGAGIAPTISIATGYIGQTSITTLGTISSGTWTGTTIAVANGGTGIGTAPTAGQILIGQTGGTYIPATLTNGTNISITSASGSITINTTGIPSGSGASNEIAFWSGTTTLTGTAGFTYTTTSGANLFASAAGTSTATAATAANTTTITYTGGAGSVSLSGISVITTATPGSASTAAYIGSFSLVTSSGGTNNFMSGAEIIGSDVQASFTTAYTTGATVCGNVICLLVAPSVGSTNATGTNTISNVYGIDVAPGTWTASGGGGLTVTNYYGLYLGTVTLSTTTIANNYGVYQADVNATNSFAGPITNSNTITQTYSSAASTSTTAAGFSTTYTGGAGSVSMNGLLGQITANPGSASTGNYYGLRGSVTSSGGTNNYMSGATMIGNAATVSFTTAYVTGATVLAQLISFYAAPSVGSTNASGTNTITSVFGVYVAPGTWTSSGGGGLTVTNYYGIYLGVVTLSTTTITNRYGVYQADGSASNTFAGVVNITNSTAANAGATAGALVISGGAVAVGAYQSQLGFGVGALPAAANPVNVQANFTGGYLPTVKNTTAGTGNYAGWQFQADTASGYVGTLSSTFTTAGVQVGNSSGLFGGGAGGVWIVANAGPIAFAAGGTTGGMSLTLTTGAQLFAQTAGTSTATATTTAHSSTITFTGAATGTMTGMLSTVTGTPGSAATGTYVGVISTASITGAANTNAAGATILGGQFNASFSTSNTSGATVLASLQALQVAPSVGSTNATTTNIITNVYGIQVLPGTWTASGGGGLTVTNYYGLYLATVTLTTTTITNRFGVYQQDASASNVLAGATTEQGLLTLNTATANLVITQGTASSGAPVMATFTGAAHTGLTASTEVNDFNFNLNRTVTFANGTIGTQRAVLIQAPTYQFTSAGTITKAATFAISGAPGTGSHTTYTNTAYAFWVQAGQSQFDGNLSISDANNIILGTTTGTQFGTSSTQKIGFFGATAVIQQTGNAVTGLSNLGLITTATWPAASLTGQVAIGNGGTGLNVSSPANGTLFIGNGTGFTLATLSAGTNITVTNTSGVITIAATGVGTVNKYATSIGNGSLTTFTVTHSLGTLDVVVTIFDNGTGAEITTDVIHATINTLTVNFAVAPSSNQYRVIVEG